MSTSEPAKDEALVTAVPRPAVPLVSVVVPTYNRPLALQRCLSSLARLDEPGPSFEVVVVDDGSEPPVDRGAAGAVQVPNLTVIGQPHAGAAAARMAGVARARGTILAFVDDDCTVPPDYLAAIERLFREHPDTQVAQVQIVNPEPENPYGRLWAFTLDRFREANVRRASDGRLLSGTLGGVMVARRELVDRVGFDPRMRWTLEDADLRYQLQGAGIDVYYAPEIRVHHHVPRTLRGYLEQFFRYGRGALHLRRKWGTTPAPFRYRTLTSPRDLLALARAEGPWRGARLYGILWLRRAALVLGGVYEICRLLRSATPSPTLAPGPPRPAPREGPP